MMYARRTVIAIVMASMVAMWASSAEAAIPYVTGTYVTANRQGKFTFTPVKRVIQFGYQGTIQIDGKKYPGVLYFPRTGGVGLAWYYGVSGNTAGNVLGTPQADGTYSGPISFYNKAGTTTDSGTATFK